MKAQNFMQTSETILVDYLDTHVQVQFLIWFSVTFVVHGEVIIVGGRSQARSRFTGKYARENERVTTKRASDWKVDRNSSVPKYGNLVG